MCVSIAVSPTLVINGHINNIYARLTRMTILVYQINMWPACVHMCSPPPSPPRSNIIALLSQVTDATSITTRAETVSAVVMGKCFFNPCIQGFCILITQHTDMKRHATCKILYHMGSVSLHVGSFTIQEYIKLLWNAS